MQSFDTFKTTVFFFFKKHISVVFYITLIMTWDRRAILIFACIHNVIGHVCLILIYVLRKPLFCLSKHMIVYQVIVFQK